MFVSISKKSNINNQSKFLMGIIFFVMLNLAYLISKKMLVVNFFILTVLIVQIIYYIFFTIMEVLPLLANRDNVNLYKIDTVGFTLLLFLLSIDSNFFLINIITNSIHFNIEDLMNGISIIIGSIALFNFTSGIFLMEINLTKRLIALQIALLLLLDELIKDTFNIHGSQVIALILFFLFYICQSHEIKWDNMIKKSMKRNYIDAN
jgi:hypothetical protein